MPATRPRINFIRGQGGLGRPFPGSDHISAMLFYYDTLPAGFASDDRIKKIFSTEEAENLGIVDTHSDETLGTGGNVEITQVGATDDIESIFVEGALLGTYTIILADDADDEATGLRVAINARTIIHGWTAAGAGANVLLTQPAKLGVRNETGSPITFTSLTAAGAAGTGTATVTQVSGGAGSVFAVMHYHISEFFRMNPKGILYVGIYAEKAWDGDEIQTMQNSAVTEGTIKQMGVFTSAASFATGQVTLAQTAVTALKVVFKPLQVLFTSDFSSATISALSDLSALTAQDVGVVLGEDGVWHEIGWVVTKVHKTGDFVNFQGRSYQCIKAHTASSTQAPWDTEFWIEYLENLPDITGYSISCMGNALGTTSFAKVNENIGWKQKFPLVTDNNLSIAGFATGDTVESQTSTLLDTINNQHYIFIEKPVGAANVYYVDNWTAVAETSDFATIENNRTINKAERGIRTFMLPNQNAPLFVNEDGTLREDTIAVFTNDADKVLKQMEVDEEISARAVTIDSAQNVLSTSKIVITCTLVPVGTAREIEINIGFATKIVTTS